MRFSGFFETNLPKLLFVMSFYLLVSCSGSGGDSNNAATNNPTTNTVLNVSSQISNIISSAANGTAGAGGDTQILADILGALGVTLPNTGNQRLSDDLIALIGVMMDPSTSAVSQTGNMITIVPSAADVCNHLSNQLGFPFGGQQYNDCLQVMPGMQLVLDTTAADSGSLTIGHNAKNLISLDYSPSTLATTFDLADMFAALNSMTAVNYPGNVTPQPDVLTGETVFTLTQLGVDHGSFLLQITQAIDIQDASEGISFSQGASTLFSADADGVTGSATVSSQLGAISAMLPVIVDEINGIEEPASYTVAAGSELTLGITNGGADIDGIVTVGATDYDIDSQDEFDFMLDPEFSVSSGVITLDTPLVLSIGNTNSANTLDNTGTLDVNAPAGSSFKAVSSPSTMETVYEVQTGSITFAGTGDFASYTATVNIGECFNFDGPTACPVMAGCNFDVTGVWDWDVFNINSSCGPEPGWEESVLLTQTGCDLVMTDFVNAIGLITGNVSGDTVTIGPFSKIDGVGETTATFTMTVAPNGLTMSGNEAWSYIDPDNTSDVCIAGSSDIIATKR